MKKISSKLNPLQIGVLIVSVVSILFVAVNIVLILTGSSISIVGRDDNQLENEHYKVGNNATSFQKEEFAKLTDAIEAADDDLKIADAVARSFVADLFTWTNKDGNYEVGGLQYIYGSSVASFQAIMRDSMYKDLDLFIAQYGRDYLPEVSSIYSEAYYSGEFATHFASYPSFYVYLNWEYKDHTVVDGSESKVVDTSDLQHEMHVYIIKNETGRFEVVQFFDSFE